MKKRIFSPGIFIESMRQLKIAGLIFSIVMCIEAVMITVGSLIDVTSGSASGNATATAVTILQIHPIIVLTMIAAPILMLCAFNWLNRRNTSDFYHSICETRECVFISTAAAVIAWTLIAILSSTLIAVVSHQIFPHLFIINYTTVFTCMFTVFAGSMFTAACVAVAMAVTGTVFNNIIISGILMFLPQSLIFAVRTAVDHTVPIMTGYDLLGKSYNVIFSLFEGTFFGYNQPLYSIPSGIYTLVIALLYFVLALFLFKIRKSEYAGNPSVGKKMQVLCRVLVGTVFSIIPTFFIFGLIVGNDHLSADELFGIIVLYIIMIVAVCVYELISSKKIRNLIGAAKSLIPIAVINLAIIGIMYGAYTWAISFTPDAGDIKSISIITSDSLYYQNNANTGYFNAMSKKIEIKNANAKEIISTALSSCVEKIKEGRDPIDSDYTYIVKINTFTGTRYRAVSMTAEQYQSMRDIMSQTDEYRKLYTELPTGNTVNISASAYYYSDYNETEIELTKAQQNKLYELVCSDHKALGFDRAYAKLRNELSEDSIGNITVNVQLGTDNYIFDINISNDMPQAFDYLMQIICKNQADSIPSLADMVEKCKVDNDNYNDYEKGSYEEWNMDITLFNITGFEEVDVETTDESSEQPYIESRLINTKKLAELIRKSAGKEIKHDTPMITIKVSRYVYDSINDNDNNTFYMAYIALDSNKFIDLVKAIGNDELIKKVTDLASGAADSSNTNETTGSDTAGGRAAQAAA